MSMCIAQCGGTPMYQVSASFFQTALVQIYRHGGMDGLVGRGSELSAVCAAVRLLPLRHMRPPIPINKVVHGFLQSCIESPNIFQLATKLIENAIIDTVVGGMIERLECVFKVFRAIAAGFVSNAGTLACTGSFLCDFFPHLNCDFIKS